MSFYIHVFAKDRCGVVNNLTNHCVDEGTHAATSVGDLRALLQAGTRQARAMRDFDIGRASNPPNYREHFESDTYRNHNANDVEAVVVSLEEMEQLVQAGILLINPYAFDPHFRERIETLNAERLARPSIGGGDVEAV